jgi:hypothetical protein
VSHWLALAVPANTIPADNNRDLIFILSSFFDDTYWFFCFFKTYCAALPANLEP